MVWILFLLAIASFMVLCIAKSVALGFVCMVMSLVFVLAGIVKLMASRVDNGRRETGRMLSQDELRVFREQAEARAKASTATAPDANQQTRVATNTPPPPPSTSA